MKKKLSLEDNTALLTLRARLEFTIRFFEEAQDFPSGVQLRKIVEDAATKHDIRTLRLVGREIDAMAAALTHHEREGLEAILRERYGFDMDEQRAKLKEHATFAIARGAVASEKERRNLEDYAEMLQATGGDRREIEAIRRVLDAR